MRCVLDRDEDMCISGKRSPVLAKYKVGFSNDGIIKALDIKLYTNAGCTPDVSPSVSYELIAVWQEGHRFVPSSILSANKTIPNPVQGNLKNLKILITEPDTLIP